MVRKISQESPLKEHQKGIAPSIRMLSGQIMVLKRVQMMDVKSPRIFCCLATRWYKLPLHSFLLAAIGRYWGHFPILEPVSATNQRPA